MATCPAMDAIGQVLRTSALWHLPTLKLLMQMETLDTNPDPNAAVSHGDRGRLPDTTKNDL